MIKRLYFKHDIGARNDLRLQELVMKHGAEGLGIYWCLIEVMYENGGFLPAEQYKSIAFVLHVDEQKVSNVLQSSLFTYSSEDEAYYSERVLRELATMQDLSEKRKASIRKRWEKYNRNTNVKQTLYDKDKDKDKDKNIIAEELSSANARDAGAQARVKGPVAVSRSREYKLEQIEECAKALGMQYRKLENMSGWCGEETARGKRCDKHSVVEIDGKAYCLQHAQMKFVLMYDIRFIYTFIDPKYAKLMWTWLKYKQDRKENYKSKASVQAFYSKLLRLAGNDPEGAAAIIEQSMANNWAGIFALKNERHGDNNRTSVEDRLYVGHNFCEADSTI